MKSGLSQSKIAPRGPWVNSCFLDKHALFWTLSDKQRCDLRVNEDTALNTGRASNLVAAEKKDSRSPALLLSVHDAPRNGVTLLPSRPSTMAARCEAQRFSAVTFSVRFTIRRDVLLQFRLLGFVVVPPSEVLRRRTWNFHEVLGVDPTMVWLGLVFGDPC